MQRISIALIIHSLDSTLQLFTGHCFIPLKKTSKHCKIWGESRKHPQSKFPRGRMGWNQMTHPNTTDVGTAHINLPARNFGGWSAARFLPRGTPDQPYIRSKSQSRHPRRNAFNPRRCGLPRPMAQKHDFCDVAVPPRTLSPADLQTWTLLLTQESLYNNGHDRRPKYATT